MNREPHVWKVTVQSETGKVTEDVQVKAHWDPDHELTKDSVGWAAAGKMLRKTDQKHAPIAVELAA